MVLPLLALTWMSAVLAMTDRRSVLFQALFAVFNSAQGFVITAVHCFLRREVGWASPVLVHPPCQAGTLASPPVQTERMEVPARPLAGQPWVWQPRAWGSLAPGLPALAPLSLPLGWMCFCPSNPPGSLGGRHSQQAALWRPQASRHPLPAGPGRGEVPDGRVPDR